MEYTEQVMDHFMNPRNMGDMPDASGVGTVGNAKCGDIMRIYIKVENDVITDVKFKTFGCGAAIATSSKATELVKGLTLEEAEKITNKMVMEALEKLNRESGITIVMISSELEELRQICDRIAIVSGGRIAGILPATQPSEAFGELMVSSVV